MKIKVYLLKLINNRFKLDNPLKTLKLAEMRN